MVNDADAIRRNLEKAGDLSCGEMRDADDALGVLGGIFRLAGEARTKLRTGIFSGENEQIVKRGDGAAGTLKRQALVESMEQVGFGSDGITQQAACAVAGQTGLERFQEPVRPVVEAEGC